MAEYKGIKAVLRQFYVLLKKILDDTSSALSTKIESVENSLADMKVDADHFEGTLPIAKGGTGATTGQAAFDNITNGIKTATNPVDSETMLLCSTSFYKTTVLSFWEYIKSKISSVLGLTATNYGGTASKANTATGISYTGESSSNVSAQQVSTSFNNSEANWASYIICNHGNGTTYYHQMLRLSFFEDKIQLQRRESGTLKGWKTIAILSNANTWSAKQTFSSGIVIPTSQPSTLVNGDIWIV